MKTAFTAMRTKTIFLSLILFFAGWASLQKAQAQGIDDLGVVWSKTYGQGNIFNIKPNSDGTYTACGYPWKDGVSTKLERLEGLVIEFDESGNELRRATARIPQTYIDSHPGDSIASDALAQFDIAFKTDDGGFLAFGKLLNQGAPVNEKEYGWVTGNYEGSVTLIYGVWIVKFDADLNIVKNTLVRGVYLFDGWITAANTFLIAGYDAGRGENQSYTNVDITLLREYDQNGNMIQDMRANYREISSIYKYPDNSFVATTPNRLLRIDASLNITSVTEFASLSLPSVIVPWFIAVSPSYDGGIFITTSINSSSIAITNYQNGMGLYKIDNLNQHKYNKIRQPADTIFYSPLLLPGSTSKYVGTAAIQQSDGTTVSIIERKIYELTDNGTSYTYRTGDPYPDGTALKAVSQTDGFFSCGSDNLGNAAIAKLSTCAQFKLDVGTTVENHQGQTGTFTLSGRNISYTGETGAVTLEWELTDITQGGSAINETLPPKSTSATIPPLTVSLKPDKNFAILRYTVTAVDSYMQGSVAQTCQQTQTVLIKLYRDFPDNIIDADCYVEPAPLDWEMQEMSGTDQTPVWLYQTPVTGNIDDDDIPEIIVSNATRNGLIIYKGNDLSTPHRTFSIANVIPSIGFGIGTVRTKISESESKTLIIIHYLNGYLQAYNIDGSSVWTSAAAHYASSVTVTFGFADFNHDGYAEIYIGNRIFDAATGLLLCSGTSTENTGYSAIWQTYPSHVTAVGDVLGNGELQLVAGNQVYEVNINSRTVPTSNSMTVVKQLTTFTMEDGSTAPVDGATAIADINRDGRLDVIVRRCTFTAGSDMQMYVWTPSLDANGRLLANKTVPDVIKAGLPLIGDIDGDKYPEIVFICGLNTTDTHNSLDSIYAFKYIPGNNILVKKWGFSHWDASGFTGLTLFDFNQDGITELVYRDNYYMRILNGSLKSHFTGNDTIVYDLSSPVACQSGTGAEYPVVADIDNDKHAEIITAGPPTNNSQPPWIETGVLRIFKGGAQTPWAPARSVWNQPALSPVYVNADLTVPAYPLNPATFFPGDDGVSGTTDDVQPYNNLLQQQTALSKHGTPIWLAINAQITGNATEYYDAAGDSLTITLQMHNAGDAAIQPPFYVSAYKNDILPANVIATDSIMNLVYPGGTEEIKVIIRNVTSLLPINNIKIQLNDKGNAVMQQSECDYTTNAIITPLSEIMMAHNDHATTVAVMPVKVDVLANDSIPDGCTPTVAVVAPFAKHGVATEVNDSVQYVSTDPGFIGFDTVTYSVSCNGNTSVAKVIVLVNEMPDNITDADCYIDPISKAFTFAELAQSPDSYSVSDLSTPLVGDIDNDGITEIIVPQTRHTGTLSSNALYIFEYKDGEIVHQQTINTPFFNTVTNPYAIAKVDGNDYAAIFLCTEATNNSNANDKLKLIKYTFNGTEYTDASVRGTYSALSNKEVPQPMIADFNGDGIPEVVVYDKVFNARTMDLLVDGGLLNDNTMGFGFGGHSNNPVPSESSSIMAIADMDSDAFPEVIGGNCVYKVKITDPSGLSVGNTFTLWSKCNQTGTTGEAHSEAVDGATAIADMDGDGLLDVIVSVSPIKRGTTSGGALYIWNPRTKKVMHTDLHTNLPTANSECSPSVAFIGDVDNNKQPEICLTAQFKMYAFEYNPGAKTLSEKWNKTTADGSGATTMSMFDFNQDGSNELVYRDETHLRILNGTDGSDMITPISCISTTGNEYPVVADINGDGAAEIIVTGGTQVWVYASSPAGLWAPARKVWNQFSYNVVNVNEDLTIPRYQMNPATTFPGEDGILGTGDDIRPYNGYLQQQTSLNDNGLPIWLAPSAKMVTAPQFDYDAGIDKATINLSVANIGSAAFQAPFYVTVYRNSSSGSPKHVHTHNAMIYDGDTVNMSIVIPDFKASGWMPFDHILVRTNDNGNSYTNQAVCDSAVITRDFTTTSIIAIDDHVMVNKNSSNNRITVSVNDLKPCSDPTVEIIAGGNAKHGTASVANDSVIFYTPATDYLGGDTVTYRIYCDDPAEADTAHVYVMVMDFPDNIDDADCYVEPPANEWSINLFKEYDTVHTVQSPLVGDFDEDGYPDIFLKSVGANSYSDFKGFTILKGPDFDTPIKHSLGNITLFPSAEAIARIKWDATKDSLIFVVMENTHLLKAYDIDGNLLWTSDKTVFNPTYATIVNGRAIGFADFNNDGYAEVYVGNQIFDAVTGIELCNGGANNKGLSLYSNAANGLFSVAMDVVGDQKLELCAGNQVYDVVINDRTIAASNSMTVVKQITPKYNSTTLHNDGATVVADFDNDGELEILVQTQANANSVGTEGYLYIWKPSTEQTLVVHQLSNAASRNVPFVGDINGDGKVEIVVLTGNLMRAFTLNGNILNQLWQLSHTDGSGSTGLTLFDFNQDGIAEIVYRDETQLRIINGSLKSHLTGNDTIAVYNLYETPAYSGTMYEYSVVADVDGDGHAEILATSTLNAANKYADHNGVLRIYKGQSTHPWAPARKVWNQYMYNVVNINEDLTVPAIQMNPATVFPGADGLLGTSDDVRPYNNFLQQQTALNTEGTPLWLTPDVEFVATPVATYYGDGDSLVISAELTNIGDAALTAPFYISAYKDAVAIGNKIATDSSRISLDVGDILATTVTIRNFSSYAPLTKIIVRINDKGGAAWVQQECNYNNNTFEYNPAGLPKAFNDTVSTLTNTPVIIDVKLNDTIPAACSSVVPVVAINPTQGAFTVVNDSIKYTPNTDFYGVDSLVYRLTCTTGKTEAKVYIVVSKPKENAYIGCPGKNVPVEFEAINNVQYKWYASETASTQDGATANTHTCPAPSEWWVEAQYKGKPVAPRLKITVNAYPALTPGSIKDNDTICHNTIPQPFDNVSLANGGNGIINYQWQYSEDNGGLWTNITGAISNTYAPNALTQTTWYRREATNECGTVHTDSVKVMVYPQSLYNYPDLRIRVCPDAGAVINLSKYIDTLAVSSLQWKSVSPSLTVTDPEAGTIAADDLNEYTNVYTLTYTVVNPCLSNPVERKVYLERLKHGRMRPLRDTVVVCYELAERLNLNQIFGVDAAGTWSFDPDVTSYISRSTSSTYKGAVVMNGKAIFENLTPDYNYHGELTEKVTVTYTPGDNSCLKGKKYTITIILTPDIVK